ncbi:DeoR/GlpR family DNA-binding transcription regulator [Gracilibacillus sp. S3-1-1]|uniref:DeoR/GlpR family DNA-binding transcription regulator n=1 Tax=Gracilibacillus pellucidus TaxID=3095368 RepID=A0ACC6M2L0_9BACI|nr:DeoR/GlpR family DNA-binding transcription regulator [Gracilibacillus sp. S3-1-1]MDX8045138.1 DeoR/GlpR family DNA-binding transcription regulator [Gracilibacillus sp. S3-1-1]
MLVAERHQRIVEVVNEKKSIRVSELATLFSVTDETIRRDLEKLEKEKKLARSHGGAVSIDSSNDGPEIPFQEREVMYVKEKKEIAEEAVKHIVETDKILLDASTTAWYVAKNLPNMPVTVLTNSVNVALELSKKKQITVISTGGTLLQRSLSYVGPLAVRSLDEYHVNKAFLSCKGLHFDKGISESNEQQARVKQKMMEIADTSYILADHHKFHSQAFAHVASLSHVERIVTDSHAENKDVESLQELGLEVIKALR